MPIVDVELVCAGEADFEAVSARAVADALGAVFGSPPGGTWLRLHRLDAASYAENGVTESPRPAFVTVLHAVPPAGEALEAEVRAVTEAVARTTGRATDAVHVQYAPPALGRQAFGGVLVAARGPRTRRPSPRRA
jgi:phenylpyruvate tautomerase PptA (4-oxalocrotonate tautomerase family)